jgi:hypothetical protein
VGFAPNPINVAVPFSFGTFTYNGIAIPFSFGTVAAVGFTTNLIDVAVPFSFGTFTNNDIEFSFGDVSICSGFIEDTTVSYCINTTTGALTRYTNFGFHRIIRINGKYYGLKSDGLFILEGETDNGIPIDSRARTGLIRANDYHIKRIQFAEQPPLNVVDIPFSFGTVAVEFGAVIDAPFSFGTVAAVVTNTDTLIADIPFIFGTVAAVVNTGKVVDISTPLSFGIVAALGGGYVNAQFSFGTVAATVETGGVGHIATTFKFGNIAAVGFAPNPINVAVPFSFGTFTYSGIAIPFNLGTPLARSGFAEDTTIAYCVNTTTGALTRYTNFGFKRITRINGAYYGLKSNGLYLLEGATDNGTTIDVRARTGMFHANDYHIKRIQYAYLRENHYATNVSVTADDNDFYPTYTYLSAFNGKRVKFAMGVSGIYWDFEFSNVSGGGLNISAVEFRIDTTNRKV